jgi:glycosyltransferase involved in cell wall biosynthesis
MPAYRSASTVGRAAESVLSQDYGNLVLAISVYPEDIETIRAAEQLGAYRLAVIRRDGRGIGNGRNSAIKAVKAPLYMFLDSDDAFVPGVVAEYADDALSHPEVGLRFGNWKGISPVSGRHRQRYRSVPNRGAHRGLLFDNYIATSTVMVTAEALSQAGLFNESYGYAEDWDLWLRIAKVSPVRHMPMTVALYTETKLKRLYPREYFLVEQDIVRSQQPPPTVRFITLGLMRGRFALYYFRTLRTRSSRELRHLQLPDIVWLVPLLLLRLHRAVRARWMNAKLKWHRTATSPRSSDARDA